MMDVDKHLRAAIFPSIPFLCKFDSQSVLIARSFQTIDSS